MKNAYAESPLKSETKYFVTYVTGGTAYYPETIEAGLAASNITYSKVGSVINCSSFSDLNSLYLTINAQTPAPIVMGLQWILEDLNKPLHFQINGEIQQTLRLVRRKLGAVTSHDQTSVLPTYTTFYVPTFVNFDATSGSCIFDAIYVARTG
uniref:Uncharacterized protein n=1 Tax=viral metagenome TaxID=1070528 RepID=A0A6C0KYH3_9ZZZZ